MDPDAAVAMSGHATARKLLKAMEEFHTYIENNKGFIPNYGERYRHGERISTGFVESTVNQVISKHFCKKQQMAWTPRGANLLLPIRTRVLNGDWEATFREWYPGFRTAPQPMAACPPSSKRSPTCRPSISGWPPAGGRNGPLSRSRTQSWSVPSICSSVTNPIGSWGPITSMTVDKPISSTSSRGELSGWAIGLPLNLSLPHSSLFSL
jgi:hypothetical protein